MGHDPIKYVLWIGGVSLAVALICGAYIACANLSSRNLGLGLGALLGACVIFILQLAFEMKGTTTTADFALEFVVDYQQRSVRSARGYDQSMAVAASYRNMVIEMEASKTVAAATPPLTKEDAPKIARDLGVVSIISYLLDEQPDWQLDTRSFRTGLGTTSQSARLSTPKECSVIAVSAVREKLRAAGNIFAGIQLGMLGEHASLCLPPNTVLDVTQNSVAIRGRVCSIIVTLQEPYSSMMLMDPHVVAVARKTKQWINSTEDKLPDGSPRYAIVAVGARATVEFAALRAQDRNLDKYQRWANRVTDGVRVRFEWPE